MIELKKANPRDLERLSTAVMRLKNSSECVTIEEMKEYIDHCYYCEYSKTGDILAIVAAQRITLQYPAKVEGGVIITHPNQYNIKYVLFDAETLMGINESPARILRVLIRELVADMNDWIVEIDPDAQAKLNFNDETESTEDIISALNSNGFKFTASNGRGMLRGIPLDFKSFH